MAAGAPKIIVLSEQLRGQSYELTENTYIIGRTEDADICIPDPTVSSHHATLFRKDNGTFSVKDEGSTNGTRVNGVRLEGEPQALVNSDILQVGGVEMLFDHEETRTTGSATTQTVINLEETNAGEISAAKMSNFSPFGSRSSGLGRQQNKTAMIVFGGVTALLIAIVIIVLVVAMIRMFVI